MKLNMEYEHDKLDTALEKRAVTIDILASEIKRKNQHIKYWREKAEYHRDYAVRFQEECEGLELKIYETEKELKKYKGDLTTESHERNKLNGKGKIKKIMKTQRRTIGRKQDEEI